MLLILVLYCNSVKAQVGAYSFSESLSTYSPLVGGTAAYVAPWDDHTAGSCFQATIPFNFAFDGANYNLCYISPNGFITFGAVQPTSSLYQACSNVLNYNGAISALGIDLKSSTTTPINIVYGIEGTAPNRTFVIQWANVERKSQPGEFNFQIRLSETTNIIVLSYGLCLPLGIVSQPVQVGLRGQDNITAQGNTLIRTLSSTTSTWFGNSNLGNSTSPFNQMSTLLTSYPNNGLKYILTPPLPCVSSTTQPTNLIIGATSITSTSFVTNSFTVAPAPAPTKYMVLRSSTTTIPPTAGLFVNRTVYPIGTNVGVTPIIYRVVGNSQLLNFNQTGLTPGTTYNYWVVPYNDGCFGAPVYDLSNMLTGSQTTCSAPTIADPATAITGNDFIANWSAVAGSTGYFIDVATDSGFTAMLPGYNNLSVGSATSITVTGLASLTTYYYRVRSVGIGCTVNSNTISVSTPCGSTNIPYFENFDTTPLNAVPTCYTVLNTNGDTNAWKVQSVNFSSAPKSMQIDKNAALDMNDWFMVSGLNLNAGISYRLTFKYNTGNTTTNTETLKVSYGTAPTAGGMSLSLINLIGISNSFFQVAQVDFVPPSTGIFYIGFQGFSEANNTYIVVDDVSVTLSPTCLEPSNVDVVSITPTTASANWIASTISPALGYQYYISQSSTPPTAGTIPTGSVGPGITTVALSSLLPSTLYYIWVRGNCSSSDKSIWSREDSFNTQCSNPNITSAPSVTRCGYGTATVNATPTAGSSIRWYDAAIAGNVVFSGNSFTTAPISASVTYYAEARAFGAIEKVGPSSPTTEGGLLAIQNVDNNQNFITFRVLSETILQSVDIYPMVSGQTGVIKIRDNNTLTIKTINYTTLVSGGATLQQININQPLVLGNYSLFFETLPTSGIRMNSTNAAYEYTSSIANITGVGVDFSNYLGAYNWKFTTQCLSPRVAVPITVSAPPAISLSMPSVTICEDEMSVPLTIIGASAYDTSVWSPTTGVNGTFLTGFTFNPTVTTTYTLLANQSSGSLCGNKITFTVIVKSAPSAVSVLPGATTICLNSIQPLTGSTSIATPATVISENFNAPTNNWEVANTSIAGNTLASQWTLRQSPYFYSSAFYTINLISNDNSQFYTAISDAQSGSPGTITHTTLTSPSFSLAGFTTAYLNFYHYLRFVNLDSFQVQVSPNNGSTWTTIQTYIATQGTTSNFANVNLNLSAYLGNPTLKIRFNYDSNWGYAWALDNVVVSGTLSAALTWSPVTGLYSNATATIPYVANTPVSVVYAKPTSTITYSATLTGSNGCTRSNTTTITVNPLTVSGTISSNQTICTSSIPNDITLAGNLGNVLRWEYADDAAFTINVTSIANTSNTLTAAQMGVFPNIRYFRAVVKSGVCNSLNSNIVYVSYAITTWNGTSWSNGVPTSNLRAVFSGNYTSTADLTACSAKVLSGNVLFNANHSLILTNELEVNGGTITFNDTASLVQINNTLNIGNITYKRNTTPVKKFDYTYWSSPVTPQTLSALSPLTPADKFYVFDSSVVNWVNVASNSLMQPAKGYIIRAPFNYSITVPAIYNGSFLGIPNNGTYTIPINVAPSNFNLIGNPYPSALSADAFMSNIANVGVVDATIYLWTHNTPITSNVYTQNDYAIYNYLGGTGTTSAPNSGVNNVIPNGKIAAGQSFFVKGLSAGNATFDNTMRLVGNNNQFFKLDNSHNSPAEFEKHRYWLGIINSNGNYKQTLIGYAQNATLDIDRGFDSTFLEGGNSTNLYSVLNQDYLSIQGRPIPFNVFDEVPLGYKTTAAGATQINLYDYDGLFQNQDLFLVDKTVGVIHDLKSAPYNFVSDVGTFNERFSMVYINTALANTIHDFNENSIIIYKPNTKIFVNAGNTSMKSVQVFDVRGRLLAENKNINATETSFELSTTQMLLFKITTSDGIVVSKKYVNN